MRAALVIKLKASAPWLCGQSHKWNIPRMFHHWIKPWTCVLELHMNVKCIQIIQVFATIGWYIRNIIRGIYFLWSSCQSSAWCIGDVYKAINHGLGKRGVVFFLSLNKSIHTMACIAVVLSNQATVSLYVFSQQLFYLLFNLYVGNGRKLHENI